MRFFLERLVFPYPVDQAATAAVRTVQEMLKGLKVPIEVTFCCFSSQDHEVYTALLKQEATGLRP